MTKLSCQSSCLYMTDKPCLLLNGCKQPVSHWFQVQQPDSGFCDASAQERQAVLSRIRGPQRRQDGRGRLCLHHLHGASQQRSEDVRMVLSSHAALCLFTALTRIFPAGQAHGQEPAPVVMVDELLILNPHKLSFSDAGLRIMITPHFSPRTRLSMAGRMLISEVFTHTSHILTHISELYKQKLT